MGILGMYFIGKQPLVCQSKCAILTIFWSAFVSQVNTALTWKILNLHLIGWQQLIQSQLKLSCCQPSIFYFNINHFNLHLLGRAKVKIHNNIFWTVYVFVWRVFGVIINKSIWSLFIIKNQRLFHYNISRSIYANISEFKVILMKAKVNHLSFWENVYTYYLITY